MLIRSEIDTAQVNRINICVLKRDGYIHTEAFRDLAERIEAESHRQKKSATISSHEDKEAELNIVLGGHINPEYVSRFEKTKLLVVNLERLKAIKELGQNQEYLRLLEQTRYIDFSSQNINYSKSNGINSPDYLYRPWYEPRWRRTIQQTEKVWDACFIGSMTARREAICQELIRRGVKLKISTDSYSSERDEILSKSKYIINLHAYPDNESAEICRLSYYASNKLRCVSEYCNFEEGEENISESLTQFMYADFADGLCKLIKQESRQEYESKRNDFHNTAKAATSNSRTSNKERPEKPTILYLNGGLDWKDDAININPKEGQCEDLVVDLANSWKKINKFQRSKRHGDIHFSENSFDAIIINELLETSDNPKQLIENVVRLMKPGGWLFIKSKHQDGLEAWSNPETKRAINEQFLARLQNQKGFKDTPDSVLRIKCIKLLEGSNEGKIDINYRPRTEFIEAVLVKYINREFQQEDQDIKNTAIRERKELGLTSSREELSRKIYLMQRDGDKFLEKRMPNVSILTPTFGQRFPYLKLAWRWINEQNYDKNKLEWIILTDTDEEKEFLNMQKRNIGPNLDLTVTIESTKQKECIGKKRNICNQLANGDLLVNFDDDDYYYPNRVSHAVEKLTEKSNYEIAGAQELPVYFLNDRSLWISKPGPNLACAGSFAYKKSLLSKTWYSDLAKHGEELSFTDNYQLPIASLDPFSTMICIAHQNNTFDKNKLRKRSGSEKGNSIEVDGKKYKGSSKFFCVSEGDRLNTSSQWEREYEKLERLARDCKREINQTSIFEIEHEGDSILEGIALKLHRLLIDK